jgi:dynein heavy chain, axonemal
VTLGCNRAQLCLARTQVRDFAAVTQQLLESFKATGPGLPDIELSDGLQLLQKFQQEFDVAAKRREELVLAEKLFDMDITGYPHLAQVDPLAHYMLESLACP